MNKQKVYDFLTTIPKGKVVTYGQIALFLGNKNLSRAIGNILHQNPDGEKYPCYKVVNSQGKLSCHYAFGGLAALLSMLNSCAGGVSVVNIDNGFGAGYLASMINHMEAKG